MGWKTVIIGSECKTSISLNRLKITINNDYQTIPLCDIDTIIFSHNRVVITIPLLVSLIESNINILVCDDKNDPIGVFQPFNNHSLAFKQLKNQINWKKTRKKKLWKMIVELKINSEIDCLKLLGREEKSINLLESYRNAIYNDDQTNRKAASARVYFAAAFGEKFKRDDVDAINYALNYGYKLIASYISKCIASRGLLTQLGIHHIGESNPFNLTYDFIEPLRVLIDMWVIVNVKDSFGSVEKLELIDILNKKIFLKDKWMRLTDAIEDIVDSYIGFLNEERNKILYVDISKGMKDEL